jgi:putative hydroxymethylpyrimidine transport system ATP-binding protein
MPGVNHQPAPRGPALCVDGRASIEDVLIFDHVKIVIPAGKWTCLLGPSGVGKTTILRLLAGLDDHVQYEGSITASDGLPLPGRVALMQQDDNLMPWLDVSDNIMLGSRLRGERADREKTDALIRQTGLSEHRHKKPNALSGGQRQRVALARTLMEDHPVVLLDEPFSALDARIRADMQELAARLFTGKTVCLVTHDPAEAARLGDVIDVMGKAGITEVTPPGSPAIRPCDNEDVLSCQGKLLRLLREMP